MDTTTVNLIAEKFTQAWGQMAPTLGMGFEEYCRYLQLKLIVTQVMFFAMFVCGFFTPYLNERYEDAPINTDGIWFVGVTLSVVGGIIGIIGSMLNAYFLIMAYNFPEIYTIEHIIQMAK